MSSVTEKEVLDALSVIMDPDLGKDIVSLGFVKNIVIEGGTVRFTIELTTPACPVKERFREEAVKLVGALHGVEKVEVEMTSQVAGQSRPLIENLLPSVKNVIAVASGKGGVGKSSVAVNLALALKQSGASVGLLDCDIYGPSLPMMLGLQHETPLQEDGKIIPVEKFGMQTMSMGFFIEEDQPVIWRGPMLMGMITRMLSDVAWGELDYMILDLPPGTGDVQLTLTQKIPLAGAVIVSTPQELAMLDVRKGLMMFRKVDVPIIGIVENMSYFICPCCNTRSDIFSTGAVQKECERLELPLLAEIPISPSVREGGDAGVPVCEAEPDGEIAKSFSELAGRVAARLSVIQYAVSSAKR